MFKRIRTLVTFIATFLALNVNGYRSFISSIPNGASVLNPCNRSSVWKGVGHHNPEGGGIRNVFGLNFNENKQMWSAELCRLDSDGDGRTNGEELGDPTCVWKVGSIPTRTQNITHPGICEPVESVLCKSKNFWLKCSAPPPCPYINSSDVSNVTLRFDRTNLPAIDTNYMCKKFALPSNGIYDIIADEPIVENKMVAHHMLLYACENDTYWASQNDTWSCRMRVLEGCTSLIALWSSGASGTCYPPQYGFRIGNSSNAFKYAVLQIHWTNLDLRTDLWDSSGLRLYYTPVLRPNRAGVLQIGQYDLFLPPRIKYVTAEGGCSASCTNSSLRAPVNISIATLHMHLLGRKGTVEHRRNGKSLRYIFKDEPFDYNTPELKSFSEPIEFRPGDDLHLDCTFDTTDRRSLTTFGESTIDEMCLAFFIYYPASTTAPFSACAQYKNISICGDHPEPTKCDWASLEAAAKSLKAACTQFTANCTSDCKDAVNKFKSTGCTDGASYDYTSNLFKELYDIVDYCDMAAVCNITSAYTVGVKMINTCDFNCSIACTRLLTEYRATGCYDPAYRYNMRNAPIFVAYFRSCEQFVVKSASVRVFASLAMLPLLASVVSFCWK